MSWSGASNAASHPTRCSPAAATPSTKFCSPVKGDMKLKLWSPRGVIEQCDTLCHPVSHWAQPVSIILTHQWDSCSGHDLTISSYKEPIDQICLSSWRAEATCRHTQEPGKASMKTHVPTTQAQISSGCPFGSEYRQPPSAWRWQPPTSLSRPCLR